MVFEPDVVPLPPRHLTSENNVFCRLPPIHTCMASFLDIRLLVLFFFFLFFGGRVLC